MNRYKILAMLLACASIVATSRATISCTYYTNDLPNGVWDLSGSYTNDLDGEDLGFTLEQDGKGKLLGYGSASFSDSGIDFDMDYLLKGTVKSSMGFYFIKLKMLIKGTASYFGETVNFKGNVVMISELDTATGVMYGSMKVTIMGQSMTESYVEAVGDVDMDGTGTIYTEICETDGKLTGQSIIELSNGRQIICEAKAKDKNEIMKVIAKGLRDDMTAKGSKLVLDIDSYGDLTKARGKVSGQQINWEMY